MPNNKKEFMTVLIEKYLILAWLRIFRKFMQYYYFKSELKWL